MTLAAAREAYRRHEWAAARSAFRVARATAVRDGADLDGADLSSLADAAWWLDLVRESNDAAADASRDHAATGRHGWRR